MNYSTEITDSPPPSGSINTRQSLLWIVLLTWSQLAVIGQLVYALCEQNRHDDVIIGHLAGRGGGQGRRGFVWEGKTKEEKPISSEMKESSTSEGE